MTQACHNCRRQRLKCDRSLPKCLKCIKRGEECLGYQQLFRWEQGIASRGRMAGMTFEKMASRRAMHDKSRQMPKSLSEISFSRPLTDPLIQDLDPVSRRYLSYFASDVCKDLVLYDKPQLNHFRDLIPLTHQHPVLLQIVIASSALRMSNACQIALTSNNRSCSKGQQRNFSSPGSNLSIQQRNSYQDALEAKQHALHLLQLALCEKRLLDVDVALAVVLLFIEFELIDSGRSDWKHHINGARSIINTACAIGAPESSAMSPMRRFLISNCLIFDIVGSTFASSFGCKFSTTFPTVNLSLLQDAEGNHCSSFPVSLLQLLQSGAQLCPPDDPSSLSDSLKSSREEQVLNLLSKTQSFNPLTWATSIKSPSLVADLSHRTQLASAHRAAVCIYLYRVLLSINPSPRISQDLESLVKEIITRLSSIRPGNALFTATAWSTFIAGAETNDLENQAWVVARFHELWEVEPWGLFPGALSVLEGIWKKKADRDFARDRSTRDGNEGNWLRSIRESGVDCLIL